MVTLYAACGMVAGAVQKNVGLLSVGHAVVLGCGAYAYAAVTKSGISPLFGIATALLVGSLAGIGLTILAARVNDERYALTSFGIQIVWLGLVTNLEAITGGVLGIPAIPAPGDTAALLGGAVSLVALGAIVHARLKGTAFGAGCAILGRSRELAATLGLRYILILVGLGFVYGAVLGTGGAVLAAHVSFIDPTLFAIGVSVTILGIAFFVVARGALGGLFGAALFVGVPQLVRLLGISTATAGYLQIMLSGIGIVAATAIWLRKGTEN